MMIALQFGEVTVKAKVLQQERFSSPHTGHELQRISVSFQVLDPQEVEQIVELLRDRSDLATSLEESRSFRVLESSYSYRDNSTATGFQVELEEQEELSPSALVIHDVRLSPYRYRERYVDNGIIVECLVEVDPKLHNKLETLILEKDEYFSVIREGIEDQPREMRFGHCLWSAAPAGRRKHHLVLVERSYDESRKQRTPALFEPERTRLEEEVATLMGLVEALGGILEEAGIVSSNRWRSIQESARADADRLKRVFDRATEVEDFWLD